ncbi:MAG: MFS transporter [Eubacteriales bacterium]
MNKQTKSDLLNTFLNLKGNPKWSILTEPLWFIPYSLFTPFASLYMYQLGLSSEEIGITISVGFFLQVFFALLGGVITDKLGRRLTTVIFDFISWSIPCFLWAFAQDYTWFLVAAIINASYQITNSSWNCLFIEDCPLEHLTNAFTLTHLTGMLSVFLSPIAIYYVNLYSVVEVVSVIYFVSGVSMSLKFIILYLCGNETEVGKKRIVETKGVSCFQLLSGYGMIIRSVVTSSRMLFVLIFLALTNIILITTNNFFSLYITETLDISDKFIAVFPMVRTFIMLVFVVLLQNMLNRFQMKKSLLAGFFLYILSHIVLLNAPTGNLFFICLYTILEAMAYATITPRKDALMAFYVHAKERARIYAVFNSGMILLSAPFGYIVGKLFDINPTYPFYFNIILFTIALCLIMRVRSIATYDAETSAS